MRRRNRLGSSSLIGRVHAQGARVRLATVGATGLVLDEAEPRVAFVAGRRVGGAVVRNRARRRLRAAVRPIVGTLRRGSAAVLTATPQTVAADFRLLEREVALALARVGVRDASDA